MRFEQVRDIAREHGCPAELHRNRINVLIDIPNGLLISVGIGPDHYADENTCEVMVKGVHGHTIAADMDAGAVTPWANAEKLGEIIKRAKDGRVVTTHYLEDDE